MTKTTKDWIKELSQMDISTEKFQKIISALRGPDFVFEADVNELKLLTTARIRAIVAPNYFGDVNPRALDEKQMLRRDELLKRAPKHFASHYKEAVAAISDVFWYDLHLEVGKTPEVHNVYNRRKDVAKVDGVPGSGRGAVLGEARCGVCHHNPLGLKWKKCGCRDY